MHAAVESDVYNGYYIPKGAQVFSHLHESVLIRSSGATITPNIWYDRKFPLVFVLAA